MREKLFFCILFCLCLSGCQAHNTTAFTAISKENQSMNQSKPIEVAEKANDEYDSIEDFRRHSDKYAFLLEDAKSDGTRTEIASSSDVDNLLEATVTKVSVGESYVDVYYDCTIGSENFKMRLGTYDSENGERDMQYILDSNSGVFTETDVNGTKVFYCPGMDVEKYNCYMMVLNDRMVVINIEKGYDSMVDSVMDYINH